MDGFRFLVFKATRDAGKTLTAVETQNVASWNTLRLYDVDTQYDKVTVRQDEVPSGLKAVRSKQELMSQITPTYNPVLFYDVEQYLPALIMSMTASKARYRQCMTSMPSHSNRVWYEALRS